MSFFTEYNDQALIVALVKPVAYLSMSYLAIYHGTLGEQLVDGGGEYCIQSEEELLPRTLFSLKSGLTFDLLGFVTGMDAANAHRNQQKGVGVLTQTLSDL